MEKRVHFQIRADYARNNPAELSAAAEARAGGYFADWVMQSGPSFFTSNTTEDVIIQTTLDQSIQRAAEQALKTTFDTSVREGSKAQAAIVVMSADGAVRAMVGGRKTKVAGDLTALRKRCGKQDRLLNLSSMLLRWTLGMDRTIFWMTAH